MKKNIVIFIMAVFSFSAIGLSQVSVPHGELLFEDTLSLSPLYDWIIIPSPDSNIWQVGKPRKTYLDSSLTGDVAIITDTLNSYPINLDNHFLLSIPSHDSLWAEGILSFYHRYNTDTLNDGGFIDISYDRGKTWNNVLSDLDHNSTNFIGMYSESDTIRGSIPAFSGSTKEWKYVELHWVWVALTKKTESEQYGRPTLKFRFISDSNENNKDGWLIDDLVFRGYDISGKVENTSNYKISVYPNPVYDFLNVHIPMKISGSILKIYNMNGQLEIQKEIKHSTVIDVSQLSNGIYYFVLEYYSNIIETCKLVKY